MSFNKQVLEQVARDGVTYKSLAKEMAQALLNRAEPEQYPREITLMLSPHKTETRNLEKHKSDVPIYEYETDYRRSQTTGEEYTVYKLTRRTP